MSRPRKVSVGLLSWNGRHHLELCLPALLDQRDPGCEVELLVLDNASRDGTVAWLGATFPRVCCLASEVNLGFAAGCNRLAAAATGEALVLLNNDTLPRADWLDELVRAFAAAPPDVAALSGQIVDWEGERLDFGRGIQTFDGHAFQLDFRRPLGVARRPADGDELPFACGGNMIVRRQSFLDAGGFYEPFFAYLEDVDLGWRLWAGGERVLTASGAVVRHRSGATSEQLGLYNRGFLFERNAFLTVMRNFEAGLWEAMAPAIFMTLLSRTQAMLVANNPGGAELAVDPYAGRVGDTAPLPPATTERLATRLVQRVRQHGVREATRRALAKVLRRLGPSAAAPGAVAPQLTDPRTVAQFRALSWLLGHLDAAAADRSRLQARRRRPDGELFERFPLWLVPTYPGDSELFASPGFTALLPPSLPLVRAGLGEVMELG